MKPILAEVLRVGTVPSPAFYGIERVAADPRLAPGLARELGTVVLYVTALGSVLLQKYTTWDRGWRLPGGGPLYPKTADEFLGATKITPGALYLMDAMTASVFDAAGANNLAITNTPTFQRRLEGKVGIFYDANSDNHQADVNNPAADSFLFGTAAAWIADPGAAGVNNVIGRVDAATVSGYTMFQLGGNISTLLRDGAGNSISPAIAGLGTTMAANPRVPYLLVNQVDRVAAVLRQRVLRGGAVIAQASTALGAVGDLTKANQFFGFGAIAGGTLNGGMWNAYGFYATGAQCEGANVLRDLAVGLGWEV